MKMTGLSTGHFYCTENVKALSFRGTPRRFAPRNDSISAKFLLKSKKNGGKIWA
jgi:hypothetical protein